MQEKDIKRLVIKQLKTKFPYRRRLTKKQKKALVEKAISEVMASYQPSQAMHVPIHELTNTPATPADIIPLSEMGKFINDRTRGFLPFTQQYSQRYLDDQELRLIDSLLDDRVLNDLLAGPGYTPAMRQVSLAHLFRAELLKALRYADLSYRKYCALLVNRLENKSIRAFLHLPLHKKILVHHSQLSQFRSTLTITHLVNLMVYVTHLLVKEINLPYPFQICGMERSYNLFKHGAGLERLRLKSQQSVMAAVTFAQLATVLTEIARHHQAAKKEPRPKQLQLAA